MKTSANGRKVITEFEGCVLKAYLCSAGVLTIGVGHTSAAGAPVVAKGMVISKAEADEILTRDLGIFEAVVNRLVRVNLNQNQFDALVSFVFNLGEGNFSKSTLLRKLNAGDYAGASDQFAVWNRAGGKVLTGLTKRRRAEATLFNTPAGATEPAQPVAAVPEASTPSTGPTGFLQALLALFRKG